MKMAGRCLMFNRNRMEALETYATAFDAKIGEARRYGDAPSNPAFPTAERGGGYEKAMRF
jgi:uncharacterized glyoxalase superfamily protein PhnB